MHSMQAEGENCDNGFLSAVRFCALLTCHVWQLDNEISTAGNCTHTESKRLSSCDFVSAKNEEHSSMNKALVVRYALFGFFFSGLVLLCPLVTVGRWTDLWSLPRHSLTASSACFSYSAQSLLHSEDDSEAKKNATVQVLVVGTVRITLLPV